MIVYGSSVSPFVRKVLAFIGEKGLTAQHLPIAPKDPRPDFQACSPLGKIPGFSDGDYRLADSTAICHYLERKHPTPALFPADAETYGRMIWFDKFSDTVLFPVIGAIFFNLILGPKLFNTPTDMAVVEKGLNVELPPILDYLETQAGRPFLVGDNITLADISIASPFVNLKMAKHGIDAARWPKFAAYVAGIVGRPTIAGIRDQPAAA